MSVKEVKKFQHTVIKYEGHILDILGLIKSEKKTGKLVVDFNQGSVRDVELDTREKIIIDGE